MDLDAPPVSRKNEGTDRTLLVLVGVDLAILVLWHASGLPMVVPLVSLVGGGLILAIVTVLPDRGTARSRKAAGNFDAWLNSTLPEMDVLAAGRRWQGRELSLVRPSESICLATQGNREKTVVCDQVGGRPEDRPSSTKALIALTAEPVEDTIEFGDDSRRALCKSSNGGYCYVYCAVEGGHWFLVAIEPLDPARAHALLQTRNRPGPAAA